MGSRRRAEADILDVGQVVVELAQVVVVLPVVHGRKDTASCQLWQILSKKEQVKMKFYTLIKNKKKQGNTFMLSQSSAGGV